MSCQDAIEYAVLIVVIGVPMFCLSIWLTNALEDRFRGPY